MNYYEKRHATNAGFAHMFLMLGMVLILAIGGIGYYVLKVTQRIDETNQNAQAVSGAGPVVKSDVPEGQEQSSAGLPTQAHKPVIPASWKVHEFDKFGFSFAFPAEWGTLNDRDAGTTDYIMYKQTGELPTDYQSGIGGNGEISVVKKSHKDFSYRKYGVSLEFAGTGSDAFWRVTKNVQEEKKSDGSLYKAGDRYDIPVDATIGTTKVFDKRWGDESAYTQVWAFEVKDSLVQIRLPYVSGSKGDGMAEPSIDQMAAYNKLSQDVLKSIGIR